MERRLKVRSKLSASIGAIFGGTLNDAKMVIESRRARNMYLAGGKGRGIMVPNILVKLLSLYRARPMLTRLTALNFAKPLVVALAGWSRTVELIVSTILAVE